MITDAQLRFSSAQPITTAGTTVSSNDYDLLSANQNLGRGRIPRARVTADVAFVGGTSVQAQYVQSANSDLSSPDILVAGPVVLTANLTAGAILLDVPLPTNTKRYVGFNYVSVGTFSAGTVSAFIVSDSDYNPYVPSQTGR